MVYYQWYSVSMDRQTAICIWQIKIETVVSKCTFDSESRYH